MDVQSCLDAGQEAIDKHDASEIFTNVQGNQFTSLVFTDL